MLNALKEITLYDVFGYLFPGFVFLAAIAILFWAIFNPATTLLPLLQDANDIKDWSVVVISAYILGHLVQGIGNLVVRYSEGETGGLHAPLVSKARSNLASMLQIPQEDIDGRSLYQLCDEFIVQSGKADVIGNRDIYIYREGFYRGMTVSLAMLSLSLIVVTGITLVPGTSLRFSDTLPPASLPMLLPADIILLIGIWLSLRRYRRFAGYRVRQAILGFLVMSGQQENEGPQSECAQ